jgi:hypothetical protein
MNKHPNTKEILSQTQGLYKHLLLTLLKNQPTREWEKGGAHSVSGSVWAKTRKQAHSKSEWLATGTARQLSLLHTLHSPLSQGLSRENARGLWPKTHMPEIPASHSVFWGPFHHFPTTISWVRELVSQVEETTTEGCCLCSKPNLTCTSPALGKLKRNGAKGQILLIAQKSLLRKHGGRDGWWEILQVQTKESSRKVMAH